MSRIVLSMSAGIIFVLAAALAPAQSTMAPNSSSDRYSAAPIKGEDPKGYFQSARDSFNSKNFDKSAKNLRMGADILRRDAGMAKGAASSELEASAKDLDKLADRIQSGEVRSVDDLNDKVGDAYRSLSNFHYQMARESYDRNRAAGAAPGRDVETGNYLNAAAIDLESWATFTGHKIEGGTRTAIVETKELAGKLIAGTGKLTEKTAQALDNLGTAIKDYGRGIVRRNKEQAPPESTIPDTTKGTQY